MLRFYEVFVHLKEHEWTRICPFEWRYMFFSFRLSLPPNSTLPFPFLSSFLSLYLSLSLSHSLSGQGMTRDPTCLSLALSCWSVKTRETYVSPVTTHMASLATALPSHWKPHKDKKRIKRLKLTSTFLTFVDYPKCFCKIIGPPNAFLI